MHKAHSLCLRSTLITCFFALTALSLPAARGQQKTNTADQLYIEVSALGSLDYFYDHKMGLQEAGKAMGVKTEYVGPADYDMSAMITAFEEASHANRRELSSSGLNLLSTRSWTKQLTPA
jgi:basic membrane lipoprotein Med (substrate-binding protein (PBP1-ABC) superfamily)